MAHIECDLGDVARLAKNLRAGISAAPGKVLMLTMTVGTAQRLAKGVEDLQADNARMSGALTKLQGQLGPLNERLVDAAERLACVPGMMRKTIIEVWVMGAFGVAAGVLIGWMLRGLL
jgi:hypothetical protein